MKLATQNNTIPVLSGAAAGTSAMTLFSYALSEFKDKQFKEPELLAKLLNRLIPGLSKETARAEGWLLHYSVGLLFTTIYNRIWQSSKKGATVPSALLLGGISGLVGAMVWKATFNLHPNPPAIDFKKYYGQLIPAHLIFGLFTALGYRLASDNKTKGV